MGIILYLLGVIGLATWVGVRQYRKHRAYLLREQATRMIRFRPQRHVHSRR